MRGRDDCAQSALMLFIRQSVSRPAKLRHDHAASVFSMKIRGLKMGLYLKVQLGQSDGRRVCAVWNGGVGGVDDRVCRCDSRCNPLSTAHLT